MKKFLKKLLGDKAGIQTFEAIIIAVLTAALALGAVGIIGNKVKSDATNNTNTISSQTTSLLGDLSSTSSP
ncbi:MAG TPA: hypothetical protein VIK89_02750 [Cytophagaceae bacterium]